MTQLHKPSAIALFASSRRNGNTGELMDTIAEALRIEVIDLSALNITPYDYAQPIATMILSYSGNRLYQRDESLNANVGQAVMGH